jgi:hypothetical protein
LDSVLVHHPSPQAPRTEWGETSYLRGNPAERRRITQAFIHLGQEWLTGIQP